MDEILAVGVEDDGSMSERRKTARQLFHAGYESYRKYSEDLNCEGERNFTCQSGAWVKFEERSLTAGAPFPWGQKSFTNLDNAKKFACDKGKSK